MTPNEYKLLRIIEGCARNDLRMPTEETLAYMGVKSARVVLNKLTRSGYIRREIGQRNWRVIELLKGEHAGKRTAEPKDWRPHRIIDCNGDFRPADKGMDKEPSRRTRGINRGGGERKPASVTLPKLKFMEGPGPDAYA